MTTAIPVAHQARLYADQLRFSNSVMQMMLKGFPQSRWCEQPSPTDNHVMWCLGHLARSHEWFTGMMNGRAPTLPESYNALFGFKSVPVPDLSKYPPAPEVLEAYTSRLNILAGAIEACTNFDAPAETDTFGFLKTKAEAAMRCSWHIGWHLGHVSAVRRGLGIASAFEG